MWIHTRAKAEEWLSAQQPDKPTLLFDSLALQSRYFEFADTFPGLVSYAVKANAKDAVLRALCDAGLNCFDIASIPELKRVLAHSPKAICHYHNPIRSRQDNLTALAAGVRTFSVDRPSELDKLSHCLGDVSPAEIELSIRFKLPTFGGAYDFGSKFGADLPLAAELMHAGKLAGYRISLTFHPGTQCTRLSAWNEYIEAAAKLSKDTQIEIERLNVGGGFPAHRGEWVPELSEIFCQIENAVNVHFDNSPKLVCEPGRAMVADTTLLVTQINAIDGNGVYLNDGVYGCLSEARDLSMTKRIGFCSHKGQPLADGANRQPTQFFGPTCDSLDAFIAEVPLPSDLRAGDYVLFEGMGAYSNELNTQFNGFGEHQWVHLPQITHHLAQAI